MRQFSDLGIVSTLAPKYAERVRQQEERYLKDKFQELVAKKQQVPWDAMKTAFPKTGHLLIDGKTWRPTLLFDCPVLTGQPGTRVKKMEASEAVAWSPNSRFFYCNHLLPRGESLQIYQGNKRGFCWFTTPVTSPVLCEKLPHDNKPKVWMSETPMECFTQRTGIRLAKGKVVIGGLGLGWFLNQIARRKQVTEIVVVEKENILIQWLWPRICWHYPDVQARLNAGQLNIRYDDVYNVIDKQHTEENTVFLLDIWDTFLNYDKRFFDWKKKLGPKRIWGWGMFDN